MLTRSSATAEEMLPYFERLFWPLPVLNLYGRAAELDPPIAREEAVWYGYRDRVSCAVALAVTCEGDAVVTNNSWLNFFLSKNLANAAEPVAAAGRVGSVCIDILKQNHFFYLA